MNAPEDTACDRYFTPSTLTEDIARQLFFSGDWAACSERVKDRYRGEAAEIGTIFKEWLRTVGIPEGSSVEDTRRLLVTLVDEPGQPGRSRRCPLSGQ